MYFCDDKAELSASDFISVDLMLKKCILHIINENSCAVFLVEPVIFILVEIYLK